MVDSINASAGKLSDVIENKTPDVISHERSEFQNGSNIQPEVSFKENIHDQVSMKSGHDLLKAESAAKKASSKPVHQRHSGKVNESTDVRNNPDTHTDMSFGGRVPDQEAMESSHGRYTGDTSEKTPASKPAQQKNSGKVTESTSFPAGDEEADRLERMNANYEHDRAILAKTDPVFARNQFRDVGHADRNGELENMEIERIVQKSFNNGISEIIKGAE